MLGKPVPQGHRLADPAGDQSAEPLGEQCSEGDAQQRQAEVEREEHPDHLARREPDGLEDRDVPQMSADPGTDGAAHGQGGGEQRTESEEAEQPSEELVVPLGFGLGLPPGGDIGDLIGAEPGDRPLDDVVGVRGVGELEAYGAAALVAARVGGGEGFGEHPADSRRLARAEGDLGGVRDTHHSQMCCDTAQHEGVARLCPHRAGDRAVQHDALGGARVGARVEPAARHDLGRRGGGAPCRTAQLHRRLGAAGLEARGGADRTERA